MRKIYLFLSLSIDGYFEGPNHDLSWHNVDSEFNKFAVEQLSKTDLFIFGRRMYQLMESFWPQAAKDKTMSREDREIARMLNNTKKIVISKTLDKVEEKENWKNITLVRKFDAKEITRLKKRPGKEIGIGVSELALSFIGSNLIDEFRFMITPVAIGSGTPIFKGLRGRLELKLVDTRKFKSGNVLLIYHPAKNR
jgi:dihydrofolate reductase